MLMSGADTVLLILWMLDAIVLHDLGKVWGQIHVHWRKHTLQYINIVIVHKNRMFQAESWGF